MDAVSAALTAALSDSDSEAAGGRRSLSSHQLTMARILNRGPDPREERRCRTRPATPLSLPPLDTRWVSSEALTRPWLPEADRWWLDRLPDSILHTQPRVFGRKTIFLVDKKLPKSESDLTMSKSPFSNNLDHNKGRHSKSSTLLSGAS